MFGVLMHIIYNAYAYLTYNIAPSDASYNLQSINNLGLNFAFSL